MHQTLTCVVVNCMTNKGMTNGRIPSESVSMKYEGTHKGAAPDGRHSVGEPHLGLDAGDDADHDAQQADEGVEAAHGVHRFLHVPHAVYRGCLVTETEFKNNSYAIRGNTLPVLPVTTQPSNSYCFDLNLVSIAVLLAGLGICHFFTKFIPGMTSLVLLLSVSILNSVRDLKLLSSSPFSQC